MSLIRGIQPKRDNTEFVIEKKHPITGKAIEKATVVGASKAQEVVRKRNIAMSQSEVDEGYSWQIVPKSTIGAQRIAFGFKRN